jgi:hypothetical protein
MTTNGHHLPERNSHASTMEEKIDPEMLNNEKAVETVGLPDPDAGLTDAERVKNVRHNQ